MRNATIAENTAAQTIAAGRTITLTQPTALLDSAALVARFATVDEDLTAELSELSMLVRCGELDPRDSAVVACAARARYEGATSRLKAVGTVRKVTTFDLAVRAGTTERWELDGDATMALEIRRDLAAADLL